MEQDVNHVVVLAVTIVIMEALKATFGPKKEHLLPTNRQAMERGAAAVETV